MILVISQDQRSIFAAQQVSQGNMVFELGPVNTAAKSVPNLRQIDVITSTYMYWHVSVFLSRSFSRALSFLTGSSYSMGDLRKQKEKYFLKFSLLW